MGSMGVTYADIEPLQTQWLWQDRLARGEVTLIAGAGAVGKGQLLCDLAARVSRGDWMPGCEPAEGEPAQQPGTVIMVTPEDDPNETMSYRLRAAGADLSRVVDFTLLDGGAPFELPDSVGALRALVDELGDVRLIVIDPLLAVVSKPVSTNLAARRVMAPLMRLAKETGTAVVCVHHTVKSGAIAGSKGLTDVLRCVYTVRRDPENDAIRIMHLDKGNNTVADDLRFTVISTDAGPRAVWLSRDELTQRRTAWRRPAPPRRFQLPAMGFSAMCATRGPAGSPVVRNLGSHDSLSAAQAACQQAPEAGGRPLAWRKKDGRTVTATAPGASFAVSFGRK